MSDDATPYAVGKEDTAYVPFSFTRSLFSSPLSLTTFAAPRAGQCLGETYERPAHEKKIDWKGEDFNRSDDPADDDGAVLLYDEEKFPLYINCSDRRGGKTFLTPGRGES